MKRTPVKRASNQYVVPAVKLRNISLHAPVEPIIPNATKLLHITKRYLNASPLLRTAVCVGTAIGIGDVMCQKLVEKREHLDAGRTYRMAFTGLAVIAPMSYKWNMLLERTLPGSKMTTVMTKSLLHALVMPTFISANFTTNVLLAGGSIADVKKKIKDDMFDSFVMGLGYWPCVGVFQFTYIPLARRAMFGGVSGCFWNAYISYKLHQEHPETV